MRDIKFKFWLGHTKKMTYGHDLKEIGKIIPEFTDDIISLQYTGFKDKNDKEIYEGDIIKPLNRDFKYRIEFKDGCFICYHYMGLKEIDDTDLRWGLLSRVFELDLQIEVIGNIYDV